LGRFLFLFVAIDSSVDLVLMVVKKGPR